MVQMIAINIGNYSDTGMEEQKGTITLIRFRYQVFTIASLGIAVTGPYSLLLTSPEWSLLVTTT